MDQSIELLKKTAGALPRDIAYIALVLFVLFIARIVKDLLTPYKLSEQLTTADNPAVGMSLAGYYISVLIVCIGPLRTAPSAETVPLWKDLLITGGWALLGIVLLNAARILVDKVLLTDFSVVKEIVEDRNIGTGAVEMGAYVASGLVVAAALQGQGGGPHTALAFFALGQVALIAYGRLYCVVCRYDVHGQIEKDNVAAGVALGLNLVACGVVLAGAIAGDFLSWEHNLMKFAMIFILGAIFLLILRVLIDFLLFPGVRMDKEIEEDKNLNAAWVEGAVLAGMAALLVTIL